MRSRVNRSRSRAKKVNQWVQDVTSQLSHPGALSHKAAKAKMSTIDFANNVLKNSSKQDLRTRRQAQFFVNINRHNKKRSRSRKQ